MQPERRAAIALQKHEPKNGEARPFHKMNPPRQDGLEEKGLSREALQQRTPLEVLIIEDSEDDAELIADALRKGGFEPRWQRVESAEGMQRALAERQWDLILADHKLPSFSAM